MHTRTRLALAALALVALAGCSSAGGGGDSAADGGAAEENAGIEADASAAGSDVGMDTTGTQQRQVIVTAQATVQVDDPSASADDVVLLVESVGGHVEGREEQRGNDDYPGHAWLVLRVPAEELSGVIDDLETVGDVLSVSQSEDDVTGTVQDLDARIAALETSTQRLLEIMAEADDTTDLLAIEKQLSERQADLEALQTQRDALGDQVALSTLTVTLDAEPVTPVVARGGFVGGLESGWNALVSFVGMLLVALGALLPWVVALGLPALALMVVLRRRRKPAPAQAAPPTA